MYNGSIHKEFKLNISNEKYQELYVLFEHTYYEGSEADDEGLTYEVYQESDWIERDGYCSNKMIMKMSDGTFYQVELAKHGNEYDGWEFDDPIINEVVPKEVVIKKTFWEKVKS